MPAGQPTKYKKEYCQQLIDFMADGMPYEAFAGLIRVDRDTLYQWEKDHKEFSDAKKVGRSAQYLSLMRLWQKGVRGEMMVKTESIEAKFTGDGKDGTMKGGTKRINQVNGFNAAALIFGLKNMAGWKDRHEIGEDDQIETMDFGDDDDEA